MVSSILIDRLNVSIYHNLDSLGMASADHVTAKLTKAIRYKGFANLILATGASQFSFLDVLKKNDEINWSQITVFHLDEYVGIPDSHPASFRKYLHDRILKEVKPFKVNYLHGDASNLGLEIKRYESLLKEVDIDVACIGIGENGHIAFNDPPVADFHDPALVKKVELDEACRLQQVGEGWFEDISTVPTHALTLTIPAIMRSKSISCVVPDSRKAEAVKNTLHGLINKKCPASILRTHPDCRLFLDHQSSKLISR